MEDCAGNSVASLKGMCLCLAQARLRATDTRSASTVYRSTKQTKVMKPYSLIRCVCVEPGILYHGPSLIKHKDMKPPGRLYVKKHFHIVTFHVPESATEGHFQCRSNTGDIFRATEIRKHQYLKSHYHEQTPFLSLNYKSVNSLIYLLCPWPIFWGEVCSFLAGHWYFNSVLIIGREKLKGRRNDEVSPHRWFSTMSALWHIFRSFRDEWNTNETHRLLE